MKRATIFIALLLTAGAFLGAQARDRYESNNTADTAYALSGTAARITDLTLTAGDIDWFRVETTRTMFVKIGTKSNMDTLINIYGPNSKTELFAENDDGTPDDYNASLTVSFSRPGTYYLKVTQYENSTEEYSIYIRQ
jgi:hypothetical protein